MSDTPLPESAPVAAAVQAASATAASASTPAAGPARPSSQLWVLGAVVLSALSVGSLALVWSTQQHVKALEQELVRRQQGSQDQATEARLLARQAQESSAEVAAKLGLVEGRVAESALQRSQVEELMQSLSRSRDENVLADVEAALRVAMQQAAITGSAEPLVAVLKQSEERLARYNQPRLERVRRAVARDLDRVRAAQVVDVPSVSIRLDEVVRLVDELPLVNTPERRVAAQASAPAPAAAKVAAAASAPAPGSWEVLQAGWQALSTQVWQEVRSLVRVTQLAHPEAALTAPDQAFFVRENLKLRLLNARLAILSRQFDLAQADVAQAQGMLERFFDRSSKRVTVAQEQLRQIALQGRQLSMPRPDDTLSALATAMAGR